ncbi:MAG: hypothetical protein ABW186_08535 [Rhodanobacteraceae bacterium]
MAVIVVACGVALVAAPAWELIVPGPFDWHVRTKQVWQGGLEALFLIGLFAFGFTRRSKLAIALTVVIPGVLYLRRHAVDVPFLIDTIFVESLFALGAGLRRATRAEPSSDTESYLRNFIAGICVWSAFAWPASALGFGTIIDLRWLTLALAVVAFAFRPRPFGVYVIGRIRESGRVDRAIVGALVAWGLVLFARAGVATGFDSRWYAVHPETKLIVDGSVFEPLGLAAPVYYFPKLHELLIAPLADLDNFAIMTGVGIALLAMIGLACVRLLDALGVRKPMSWLGAALCASVPAICNQASAEAKPDTLALLLVLLALLNAVRYVSERTLSQLVWFATFGLLATQAKLTAIPYVAVLALVLAMSLRRGDHARTLAIEKPFELRFASVALALAVVVSLFVTSRTLILSGMPTIGPDALVALWHSVGFSISEPVGTLNWTRPQLWSDVPSLIVDELFRPQVLPHIVISWIGNGWLLLAAIALIGRVTAGSSYLPARAGRFGAALAATGIALLLGIRYGDRGSDGNYFAAAIAAAYVFTFAAAIPTVASRNTLRNALLASLSLILAFQAAYSFTSGAWTSGTLRFDADLTRGLRPQRKIRRVAFESAGLAHIAEVIRQDHEIRRVSGIVSPVTVGFELPCAFEDLYLVKAVRPEYFANAGGFLGYLQAARIDALLVPKANAAADAYGQVKLIAAYLPVLQSLDGVRIVDDRAYTLIVLDRVSWPDAPPRP